MPPVLSYSQSLWLLLDALYSQHCAQFISNFAGSSHPHNHHLIAELWLGMCFCLVFSLLVVFQSVLSGTISSTQHYSYGNRDIYKVHVSL